MSSDHVDLGIKLLSLTLEKDCSETLPSEYPSLGSSLLALLFAVNIPKETQFYAHFAEKRFWSLDLRSLPKTAEYEVLFNLFKADKKALSRAVQVSKMFSKPSNDLFNIGCVETPKVRRRREQAGVLGLGPPPERLLPLLRCRKCSQPGCEKVESVAGTFQVCGRCKTAVYCSKDCQKRAWKEGHKDLCH
ncbi:hypothetical protein KFL_001240080 [Klebsormidium nitens]|uniref:MYND-type domain-containing protein n=1 Tax=Klebsormidium nitens TaxID=105231 RepID=A0A1Y1I203_KLENI|nr:hypothetical protein KFL_001240080 [Klebsormidium nitens]|eukprot:GAQ82777.1 hypothetical protein KFL_001240080 [Klebsormidium nitens]